MRPLYAEDLECSVGRYIDLGHYTPTETEIVEFATRWDPQTFHVDSGAATAGFFGGLIASGIHTLAIFERLAVLGAYRYWAIIAGRRISAVEFTAPVTAGLTLRGSVSIVRIDYTRPNRATVSKHGSLMAGSTTVLTLEVESYVHRRPTRQRIETVRPVAR